MRNAEKFLSQGKIRAAIGEYQRVVENDPRDFSTLNILGDLYAKNHDKQEAVGCFTQVADYYNLQGFSHKAIAVYNKISRIEPTSIEVSAKLAELYQSKGSVAEARVHYTNLAEHYQKKGQKIEALAIWKQIAELDRNNTEIYLKIAETYWQEEQFEEAAQAFVEAGFRFLKQEKYESSLTAFSRALEVKKNDLRALKGLVKAQINLGSADEAANVLEAVIKEQPHNREVLELLADCYLDMNNPPEAERTIIKLVEHEPTNYPKFLDLVKLYLKNGDVNAATRILSMSSEHLLVGGQADEYLAWTNEILARNPEQVEALRLLVRYYGWARDEESLYQSLERLAETARSSDSFEEERYALSQLVLIAPQKLEYVQRLQQVNAALGFETSLPAINEDNYNTVPQFQHYDIQDDAAANGQNGNASEYDFSEVQNSYNQEFGSVNETNSTNGNYGFEFYNNAAEPTIVENNFQSNETATAVENFESADSQLKPGDELKLQKELESIEFYIEQDYLDLAAKSLDELEAEFGMRTEILNLRSRLNTDSTISTAEDAFENGATIEYTPVENTFVETAPVYEQEVVEETYLPEEPVSETVEPATEIIEPPTEKVKTSGFEILDELKNDFDSEETIDEDYETHYHMATAYKGMGLTERAIKEFQDAINLVEKNDDTRRYFQCANLLGHCFMEIQMPNPAMMWFNRALEVADLEDEEKHALYYEIGNAFESCDERKKAVGYFEKLYAENVDFRDVSRRLEILRADNSQS